MSVVFYLIGEYNVIDTSKELSKRRKAAKVHASSPRNEYTTIGKVEKATIFNFYGTYSHRG